MKKLYFTLFTLSFGAWMNAQTFNQSNHAPSSGDQYSMFQADSNSVSKGGDGSGINWNFNSIVTRTNIVSNYTASTVSNTLWPSANVGVTSNSSNVGSMYSASATDLKFWGGNITLGGVVTELRFNSPAIYMNYPHSLNSGTISPIQGSISALSQSGTFTGVCTVTSTAAGTMVLPAKTFNDVIRVTTTVAINFTVSGGLITGGATQITDDFYSLSHSKYPILSMNSSTLSGLGTSVQKFAYVMKNYQLVGMNEEAPRNIAMQVYPVPAANHITFATDYTGAAEAAIFDVTGKNIDNRKLENGKLNMNTAAYANGLYIYRILDNNGRTLKTGRFTVEH